MGRIHARLVLAGLAAALTLTTGTALPRQALAQDAVADFYKSHVIRLIIRQGAGGSYDVYSRLIGRHIGKHIPGNPTIVPNNMPGAGGLTATNYLGNIAPKDGSHILIPPLGLAMYQALDFFGDRLKADMSQVQWIGNVTSSNPVLVTWYTSKVKTLEDAKRDVAILGVGGAGSVSAQFPAVYNNLLGTKFKVLLGFQADDSIAMERGEIDGRASATWAGYKATQPDWVRNNKLNYILQIGLKKEEGLENVPLLRDLAQNAEQQQIFDFMSKVAALTRPMTTTAGTPPERVAALRKAFMATMHDPEFRADAAKQALDIGPFMDGEEVQRLTVEILQTPKPLLAKIKTAMQFKEGEQIDSGSGKKEE
jgi:tripartite-type tricarboxylate transporter receptor subunit TctC